MVSLSNRIYNILSCNNFTKNCVFVVEPVCRNMSYKELTSICIRTRVCHSKLSRFIKNKSIYKFIRKLISRATGSITSWISTLNHKICNYTMKCKSIIKWFTFCCIQNSFCKSNKVCYSHWSFFVKQIQ